MAPRQVETKVRWIDDVEFEIGATTFRATPLQRFRSTPDRFCVVKPPDLVRRYIDMLNVRQPQTILELGIFGGGSTALINEIARPQKLVAVDLKEERVQALDAYLEAQEANDSVKAYYGVDQGDRPRLTDIVVDEFGDEPLDLVIDDASHDLALTRTSFDILFPRLRPGGAFIIEDWAWAHGPYSAYRPGETPLTALVFELIMACPSCPGLVADVTVDRYWALIQRGDLALDPESFSISSCYSDRGRDLVTGLQPPGPRP